MVSNSPGNFTSLTIRPQFDFPDHSAIGGFEPVSSDHSGNSLYQLSYVEHLLGGDSYSIPEELDTTDTHTPTPEVPRRTSIVRNLRRPWAPREHSSEKKKEKEKEKEKERKASHPLLAQ